MIAVEINKTWSDVGDSQRTGADLLLRYFSRRINAGFKVSGQDRKKEIVIS